MKLEDLTNKRFGKLLVVSRDLTDKKRTRWNCICDCGTKKSILGSHLKRGLIISCGCKGKGYAKYLNYTHGKSKTRLYSIWTSMKTRCLNKNSQGYKNYGARKIKICDEWKNDYNSFENWALNNGYQENLTLDRINNDGDYEPSNCRWATCKTQSNNTRRTIKIIYENELLSMKEISEKIGMNYLKARKILQKNNYDVNSLKK